MVKDDWWAEVGWTGIAVQSDKHSVLVRWDNGRRLNHMKKNLRIMSVTEGDNPNFVFKMRKYKKANNDII